MSQESKTPIRKTGTGFQLDKIMSMGLPIVVDGVHIVDMVKNARIYFNGKMQVWMIGAAEVRSISDTARLRLGEGLAEFAKSGGKHIVLICPNTNIGNIFKLSGVRANLHVKVFADPKLAAEEANRLVVAKPAPP
jgi:hypothetical protein